MPLRGNESRAQDKIGGAPLGAGLAPTAGGQGWQQPRRELVDEHQVTAGAQHPGTFDQSGLLIGPVIE